MLYYSVKLEEVKDVDNLAKRDKYASLMFELGKVTREEYYYESIFIIYAIYWKIKSNQFLNMQT